MKIKNALREKIILRETTQFLREITHNTNALIGLIIAVMIINIAIFAPFIAPFHYAKQNFTDSLLPPFSPGHILGTDEFGRDLFSRLIFGARISLEVGLVATSLAAFIGVFLGLISGYFGKKIDLIIGVIVDVCWSFPLILLALILIAILGPSLNNVMLSVGLTSWAGFARVTRGEVLSLKEREFVEAARALGKSNFRIIFRHILPNTAPAIIVMFSLTMANAILIEAGLSFLGLGAQPPTPSWGTIISMGRTYIREAWWLTTFPGIAIMTVVLGFNLLGDGLRDILDPRLKYR